MGVSHADRIAQLISKAVDAYELINGIHPAADLMPMMGEDEFQTLLDDVDKNGFLRPVRINDDGMVLDGRNRLCASIELGKDVRLERYNPVDPIQYVLSENLARRHLSSQQKAAIAVQAEALYTALAEQAKERQKEYHGNQFDSGLVEKIQQVLEPAPMERKTNVKIAQAFGTNDNYVAKAKKVKDHAPELLQAVATGTVDLNHAAKVARERQREIKGAMQESTKTAIAAKTVERKSTQIAIPQIEIESPTVKSGIETVEINGYTLHVWHDGAAKSTFNTANESIDWAWSTWNPVTGCLHSCQYCYARKIAENPRMSAVYPKGFEPVFHPYRLDAPKHSRPFRDEEIERKANERRIDLDQAHVWAKNVFVCSMADLFGKWVPDEWILQVFDSVAKYQQWNYLFLTKYPQRLQKIGEMLGGSFPDNCWVGTTVDEQKRVNVAQDAFANIKARVKWLSLEPLLTNLDFTDLGMFDMVAIGGQTDGGNITFTPPWEWVESILLQSRKSGTAVYFKENLLCRPKELPDQMFCK